MKSMHSLHVVMCVCVRSEQLASFVIAVGVLRNPLSLRGASNGYPLPPTLLIRAWVRGYIVFLLYLYTDTVGVTEHCFDNCMHNPCRSHVFILFKEQCIGKGIFLAKGNVIDYCMV